MTKSPIRLAVVSARRDGGGNESAARALFDVLRSSSRLEVRQVVIAETLTGQGPLGRLLARLANGRFVNLLWLLTPFILRGDRPDVALLMHGNANFILPLLRSMSVKTIVVCDAPARGYSGLRGFIETYRWRCLRWATRIVNSFAFRSEWGSQVIDIPISRHISAPHAFAPTPLTQLVFVGRLSPEKGITSFLSLADTLPALAFHVFGAGPLASEVSRVAARLPNVTLHGHVPDWPARLNAGACLLGCSTVEACWTTGAEALLLGIPVIAIESETGGPQVYPTLTPMAVTVTSLTAGHIVDALDTLNRRLCENTAPALALSSRLDRVHIRASYEDLIGSVFDKEGNT